MLSKLILSRLRKYWPEILVFGGIFGILVVCCLPDISWINTDCDGPHYLYSAKYLYPAHKTSAPLFLLLGHLFLYIPLGMEAWRMAMMSVIASTATAVFVYLIAKHYILTSRIDFRKYVGRIVPDKLLNTEEGKRSRENKARWFGLLAALIWGSGALVISQSTIIESYALVSMFGTAAFYFSLKRRWVLTVCMLGLGLATHHLILIPILVIVLANRDVRKWRYAGLLSAFLLFYLYIPITNRPPYMWLSGTNEGTNFLADNMSTAMMLVGGMSIWDAPKRILDTIGVVGVSLGLGVIPVIWWMLKGREKKWYKEPLLWLFALPITYYCFPAGTKVVTLGRWRKAKWPDSVGRKSMSIEDIVVGDTVLSYNERTGAKEWKEVTNIFMHTASKFVKIRLSNGNELKCTNNHPIGVNRKGKVKWVPAKEISVGDELIQVHYHNWQRRIWNITNKGKTVEEIFGEELGAKHRETNRVSHLGGIGNPVRPSSEARTRMRLSHIGHKPSEKTRRRLSLASTRNWKNNREKMLSAVHKGNEQKKQRWYTDPIFASRMLSALIGGHTYGNKMTKPEKAMSYILRAVCPHEFSYNGDARLGLVGKCAPDFINTNGKKKVVEVFGCYYHYCEQCGYSNSVIKGVDSTQGQRRDTNRITNYKKLGFDVLVVWEHELRTNDGRAEVAQRVKSFVYNPDAEITKVVSVEKYIEEQPVYNIEVKDNNNYFAQGLLVHNCADLAPQTIVYCCPAIAFGAVIAGVALNRIDRKAVAVVVAVGAVMMLGFNAWYFDIGNNLDPNLSARQYYDNELPKVPDGEILLAQQGWEWAMVYLYNKEEGRGIIPICAGTLPSTDYQQQLRDWGVKFDVNPNDSLSVQSTNIAYSIVEQNENVWTTIPTTPRTYGAEIVVAEGNTEYLTNIPLSITDGSMDMRWQWKPSNPYDIITGAIEVDEWVWIVFSNYNVQTMVMLGVIGFVPVWVLYMVFVRKRKWSLRKGHEEAIEVIEEA